MFEYIYVQNWKKRLIAYEDLKKEISTNANDPLFTEYGPWLSKVRPCIYIYVYIYTYVYIIGIYIMDAYICM
jgi:hypothetical protein